MHGRERMRRAVVTDAPPSTNTQARDSSATAGSTGEFAASFGNSSRRNSSAG